MFNKKCPRCGKNVEKDFTFCPWCGCNIVKENETRDFGMLGVDDNSEPAMGAGAGLPFNFSGIINNLMKQMSKEMKDMNPQDMGSINISISGDGKPMIKMNSSNSGNSKVEPLKKMLPVFSEEQFAKFSKLSKKEPKTNVRRLSQKILYELDMPGVKNSKDVMINKLETGIEIRAIASKTAYFKTISLGMQLLNYKLAKEKLVLEFKA